jgi:hypothetical protein
MGTIRLSRPGNRGVSLLVLIFTIVILSIFGTGLAIIMYAKFRSFPYVTSSHQAQALADAGVEFAIRYARDNPVTYFANIPSDSYKSFPFGNGSFGLKYLPGCPDTLYSRGTCGMATREVKIQDFGLFSQTSSASVYMASAPTRFPYTSALIYSGDRIEFTFCDPSRRLSPGTWSWVKLNSITIAATQPISIMRVGPVKPGGAYYEWVWDGACGVGSMGACQAQTLAAWDGTSDPPNASFTPTWNIRNPLDLTYDVACRPRRCPLDNDNCSLYGLTKTYSVCEMGGPQRDLSFGEWQGHFAIETRGSIPIPTTFYIAFDHGQAGYLMPPGYFGNPNSWIRNTFVFTIDH